MRVAAGSTESGGARSPEEANSPVALPANAKRQQRLPPPQQHLYATVLLPLWDSAQTRDIISQLSLEEP